MTETTPSTSTGFCVADLHKSYPTPGDPLAVLPGVNHQLARGETMAIGGPSGSGKSTLLSIVAGLDTPTSGTVLLEGQELGRLGRTALSNLRRDRIGFVFQAYNLIPVLTAFENAEYVLLLQGVDAAKRRKRINELLAAVGLEGLGHRRPSELSGGQQQRVAVARAIAAEPALILADEPTANLDSKTGTELVQLMRDLNRDRGVTFLFSSHDPKVIHHAERVVRLEDGKIVDDSQRDRPGSRKRGCVN